MQKELIKLANHLDRLGRKTEADYLDVIIDRISKAAEREKAEVKGNYKAAGIVDNAKEFAENKVAEFIRNNAAELSEHFPYGTQTIAEKLITAKADEIANCVVEIASPVIRNS